MPKTSEKLDISDHPLEPKLMEFLDELESSRRLLPSTIRIYRLELVNLLSALKEPDLKAIKKSLKDYKPATAIRKIVIWKGFLETCPPPWNSICEGLENPKQRERQPRFLTEDEVFRLEAASYGSQNSTRDRLFLALGLELGLRVTEILQLRFSDFEAEWLKVLRKGGKEQRLPLTSSIQALFHFHKDERRPQADDFVFEGRTGKSMSVRNAQKILNRLASSAGLKEKVHPHALRHTFATRMASNGISLVALKEFLGHRRMSTTERYLHVTPQHLKESLRYLKPK